VKRTLVWLLGWLLLQATGAAPIVAVPMLAINDFHGHLQSPGVFAANAGQPARPVGGADALAAMVAEARRRNPQTLVVSAGDLVGASPLISGLFHDESTVEVMNRLGLDFNAVGNHEFDHGRDELLRLQHGGCHPSDPDNSCRGSDVGTPVPFEGAHFRFLAANVLDRSSGRTLFAPYGIKEVDGVRIAFVGMTLKGTPRIVRPSGVAGLVFNDEADTVNALVPQLKAQGVQAIVVLLHQGGTQDGTLPFDIDGCAGLDGPLDGGDASVHFRRLVARFDDAVDLVISGHTHAAYNCRLPNRAGRLVPVTSAGAFGRVVTEIALSVDRGAGRVVAVSAHNRLVDRPALPPQPAVQALVAAYAALAAPRAERVIGRIATALTTAKDAACNMPAGELIADAQLAATAAPERGGAVLALMNPGGVRNPGFPTAGDVTYGQAFAAQPFGNSLVTLTLTAQDLKDLLEQQFGGCRGQTTAKLLLPSAGFSYRWNADAACGRKVSAVRLVHGGRIDTLVDDDGRVRHPASRYRVTVNQFLADGGDSFRALRQARDAQVGGQDLDALVAYLAGMQAPYAATSTPRLQRVDAGTRCP
jgi:5'-nucleotidase